MALPTTVTAHQQELAVQTARNFIRSTKRWPDQEYRLEFLRSEGNASDPIVVLDAVHCDDLHYLGRGASRSVQLHVSLRERKVVKELAYQ